MIPKPDKRFALGLALGLCCMAAPWCVGLFGAAWDWMFSGFGYWLPDVFNTANEWPANYGGGMEG